MDLVMKQNPVDLEKDMRSKHNQQTYLKRKRDRNLLWLARPLIVEQYIEAKNQRSQEMKHKIDHKLEH